jgi:hypothetical protein
LRERGTEAHNTVTVLEINSSEVWSSFRAARRANVRILEDQKRCIVAQHNGYKKIGTIHKRQWEFFDSRIEIIDNLIGKVVGGRLYLHIAPEHKPELKNGVVNINNIKIFFKNANAIEIVQTKLPNGYNQFLDNYTVKVLFIRKVETHIIFFD